MLNDSPELIPVDEQSDIGSLWQHLLPCHSD
jgi:hypothetical protein